jgi:hypothetical protein
VKFEIEQCFDAPLPDVERALAEPAFLEVLGTLPKLGRPELLDQRIDGDVVHQRVRYRFAGDLNSAARAVLDPEKLTWVEVSVTDRSIHHTDWRIEPDNYADRLEARGTFDLTAAGDMTLRRAIGELKVRMPLVGGKVEGAIVSGLREHAAAEEAALRDWLTRPEGGATTDP